jgi:sulfite reductase (NADPH) flavoprotein alpha-component
MATSPQNRSFESIQTNLLAGAAFGADVTGQALPMPTAAGIVVSSKSSLHPIDRWEWVRKGDFSNASVRSVAKYFGMMISDTDATCCHAKVVGSSLRSWQLRGLASIADLVAQGSVEFSECGTVRISRVPAAKAVHVVQQFIELGLAPAGALGDTCRGVVCSPLSGVDATEVTDAKMLACGLHHAIQHQRDSFCLPAEFRIGVDGGGRAPLLLRHFDLGIRAVMASLDGREQLGYAVSLGGSNQLKRVAQQADVFLSEAQVIPFALETLRWFATSGNPSEPRRATFASLLDAVGVETFLDSIFANLAETRQRLSSLRNPMMRTVVRQGSEACMLGCIEQKQRGLFSLQGHSIDGGLSAAQGYALASLAEQYGTAELRLVNDGSFYLLGIRGSCLAEVETELAKLGLGGLGSIARTKELETSTPAREVAPRDGERLSKAVSGVPAPNGTAPSDTCVPSPMDRVMENVRRLKKQAACQTGEPIAAPVSVAVSRSAPETVRTPEAAPEPLAEEEDHDFPWHDPGLSMSERMELANGKPLKRRLMAAMAQLDCGACGYVCQTYSEALANGTETCTNLCAPGGMETEAKLEQILADQRRLPVASMPPAGAQATAMPAVAPKPSIAPKSASEEVKIGFDRKNPIVGKFIFARPLNRVGSAKDTRHVAIGFDSLVPAYRVGDAMGVYPLNDTKLVEKILAGLGLDSEEPVVLPSGEVRTVFDAMREFCCLKSVPETLAVAMGISKLEGDADVLDAVLAASITGMSAQQFVTHLRPIQPRLYSISSSPKKYPRQIHLTVGRVQWRSHERTKLGTASTMFADRLTTGQELKVFIHRPQAFALPSDPAAPMIMVGPGTGIAPFIAFLQEREATCASGKNWLFFGDQHSATDFLYEEQIDAWRKSGVLERLDTAFSRDQAEKVYVQDRMLQRGTEIYDWLQSGAHFYVCGDAKSMAASVQQALQQIIATHEGISLEIALERIKQLQREQRYQRDVY